MHGLETIIALNKKAQREQKGSPSDNGWEVIDLEAGFIHVVNRQADVEIVIDASDPHDETDLLNFHRNWTGAKSIAYRVEQLASQYRRTVCRAA